MKRPPEHVVEEVSKKILKKSIPSEWILRDINPDYGIDNSLEIVKNDIVTGKEILIQLKGTTLIDNNASYLSYSLKTDHLKYYLEKDVPVFLVVVDVVKEKCYWVFLQHYAFQFLNVNKPSWVDQKTITVRISKEQQVRNSLDQIEDIAKGGSAYIITQKINQIPSKYLATWKSNTEAIVAKSKVAKDFLEKAFQLQFEISYHHDKEGSHEKSFEILNGIFNSALASGNKESVVKAGLIIAYELNPQTQNNLVWTWLIKISKFVEEVNNNSYNILWRGSLIETVFIKLVNDYFSLIRLILVSSQNPHDINTPFLIMQMREKIQQIFNTEIDFIKCVIKAFEDEEYLMYLDFLKRLAKMHWLWVYYNSLKGNKEILYMQLAYIEKMLLSAKKLADAISEDIKFSIVMDLAYLYNSMEKTSLRDSTINEAYDIANKIGHKGYLKQIENAKENFKSLVTIPYLINFKNKTPTEEPSLEEEEKIIRDLLRDGGIDIEGDDELAKLARIGLKDRNPERILKHCKHLFVDIVTYGPIWNMVALPETGMKILYCEKTGCIMGQSLDELLESFKNSNCKTCNFHSPRSNDWKWTRKWQRERVQPEGMKKTIENFFKH